MSRRMTIVAALTAYFDGQPDQELKVLSEEAKRELAALAAKELGGELDDNHDQAPRESMS